MKVSEISPQNEISDNTLTNGCCGLEFFFLFVCLFLSSHSDLKIILLIVHIKL